MSRHPGIGAHHVHGRGCSCVYCCRSATVPRQSDAPIAPIVDLDAARAKGEHAALLKRIDELQREADRHRHAATHAKEQLAHVRRDLYTAEIRTQQQALELANAHREIGRLNVVVDAVFDWRISGQHGEPNARTLMVEACDAHFAHLMPAAVLAPTIATPEQAREYAAPFCAPLSPEDLFAADRHEDTASQLDRAGAQPAGAL